MCVCMYIYISSYIAATIFGVTYTILCGLYSKGLLFIPSIYNDLFTVINQHMYNLCIYAVILY